MDKQLNMNSHKPNPTLTHSKRSRYFSMQSEFCPLCSKNGAKVRVKAYQLNSEEAVFMCSTEDCTWPAGYHELLFMERPFGKQWSKDWPDLADKFLANHFKKQRDSLSELSAYTPPQTPGNSKDIIQCTTTAAPVSMPVVKQDDVFEQELSINESKLLELPVIECIGENVFSFGTKLVQSELALDSKPEKSLIKEIVKDSSINEAFSKHNIVLASSLLKKSTSLINKPIVVKDEKPVFGVPEKSIEGENVQNKKYLLIGRKPKPFIYKKQFDKFDDIKKAISTNEKGKGKVVIKSSIDLEKMKPKDLREVLSLKRRSKINGSVKICKVESYVNRENKFEPKERLIKQEKCQFDVGSVIKKELNKFNADNGQIPILNGHKNDCKKEDDSSLELLNQVSSNSHNVQFDLNAIIKTSPEEFEFPKSWSTADHDLDGILSMLENDTSKANSQIANSVLNHNPPTSNAVLPAKLLKNEILNVDPLKTECINGNGVKKEYMDIDLMIEDDTLQCSVEETDDLFFNSLFSP